jgi:nucleoside-diphosphate-sugar epimerase
MRTAASPHRVLVTGSTGAIGRPLARHLAERGHRVRGFARRPSEGLADWIAADLTDRDAVHRAAEGMETIVHLGAYPNPADFVDVLLGPNVIGLHYVCEAAVEAGVRRLILASTVQVITGHPRGDRPIAVEDGPRPVNHYALTKAWAELAGDMYARVHGLSVISVRIGWFPRNTEEARRLAASPVGQDIYLSHDDANRFFSRCVESERPPGGTAITLQATSLPTSRARMEIESARAWIGYEPRDIWPEGLPFPTE